MKNIKLPTIPEPEEGTRSVLVAPRIEGTGDTNYICGSCGKTLAEGMGEGQMQNIVLKCSCGAFNDVV